MTKKFSYKEQRDIEWALDMWSKMLDAQDDVEMRKSAKRLQKLHAKLIDGPW